MKIEELSKEVAEIYKRNPRIFENILKIDPEGYGWLQALLQIAKKKGLA